MIVADWSSHHLDQHASRSVASFVGSRRLDVHPCVYYASSHSSEAIQVADLISAIRRRSAEGDTRLASVDQRLGAITAVPERWPDSEGPPLQQLCCAVLTDSALHWDAVEGFG